MALTTMHLDDIITAIHECIGVASSALMEYSTDATLVLRINDYIQRLPQKLNHFVGQMRSDGYILPYNRAPRHDMWLTNSAASGTTTTTGIQVTASSQAVFLPTDVDQWRSFYNVSTSLPLHVVADVDRWHYSTLRNATAAQATAIELLGYAVDAAVVWRKTAKLYPPQTGITPSLLMQYWRIPACFPNAAPTTELPDVDPKFQMIAVFGPVTDILRKHGGEFEKYQAKEAEMLKEMAYTSRGW